MILEQRIDRLSRLAEYMVADSAAWKEAKQRAYMENGWFTPEFIELSVRNIAENFLNPNHLHKWAAQYNLHSSPTNARTIGVVMAGNIPLVGFHDLLSVFISGHRALIKVSSKDKVLLKHLVRTLAESDPEIPEQIKFSDILRGCDAYIATGSNNTSRYFEYYFGQYPHIIRRNRSSVAILTGLETSSELEHLADDVYQFFGLGCRNVTKVYVPGGYAFESFLSAGKKYAHLAGHHKYKNNYDYNLALHILNNKFYMTNGSLLLIEEPSIFSPISQVNYEYYSDNEKLLTSLSSNDEIQCIVGHGHIPFGQAHRPGLFEYADRVDTMKFLNSL
jgi:Acyl-CoA reductase (LuxC)